MVGGRRRRDSVSFCKWSVMVLPKQSRWWEMLRVRGRRREMAAWCLFHAARARALESLRARMLASALCERRREIVSVCPEMAARWRGVRFSRVGLLMSRACERISFLAISVLPLELA